MDGIWFGIILEGMYDSKLNKSQCALALKNRVNAIQTPPQANHTSESSPWVMNLVVSGLFEVRVADYLDSNPEPEPSGVNKFLKGLGEFGSQLHHSHSETQRVIRLFTDSPRVFFSLPVFRKQDEAPADQVKTVQLLTDELSGATHISLDQNWKDKKKN